MKKFYILALFIPLLLSVPVYADSVQSYEFNLIGAQANDLVVYTKSGTNPYNFTPKYMSAEVTYSSNSNNCLTGYNFRLFYNNSTFPSDTEMARLRVFSCNVPSILYYDLQPVISNTDSSIILKYISSDFRADYTYKITVYSEIPFDSDCPEPDCPTCPDPTEASRFMNIVIDSFWKYHIAFAGVVVPLIAIFLVYRLIKGRLR